MGINKAIYVLTLLLCVVSFTWLCKSLFLGYYPDFAGYYYGPKLMLEGLNPYMGGSGLHTHFVYPPIVLMIFLPVLLVDFPTASILWATANLYMLLMSIYLLTKIFEINFFSIKNYFFMFLIFISFPVKFSLGMGQINILILLLLTLVLFFIKKNNDFVAGIFLGLSIAIKLFPLFLPVYLLLKFKKGNRGMALPWTRMKVWYQKRQLRDDLEMLDGMFVVFAIVALATVFTVPKELYLHFFFEVIPNLVSSWKLDYYNQALSGFIGRSFGMEQIAGNIKLATSLLLTAATLFIITKNEEHNFSSTALKFGTLIILSLILNNFSWQHHFIWFIIPVYANLYYLRQVKAGRAYYLFPLVCYILVSVNLKFPESVPVLFQSHVLYGALILLGFDLYLLYKKHLAKT